MQTFLWNTSRAVLHGVIVFVATEGGALIAGIPVNIGHITLVSLLTALVSLAQHSLATPAGSTVLPPNR